MAALTLQQLRVLVAVAEHRSFTRGARAIFMTQSAASQHVRSLERALGTPLLERVGGDVLPTRAGAGLIRYAQDILRTAGDAERFVAALRAGHAGRLTLGASGSAVYLISALIPAFRALHAGVEVVFQVGARDDLRDAVARGAVDVALMGDPVDDPRLAEDALCPDRIVLVASPASPLLPAAALAPLSLAQVAAQPIVAPATRTPTWRLVDCCAVAQGVALRPALQLEGTETVKKAVEAGLGIAFLSAWVVERELALGTLRVLPLDLPPLVRGYQMVRQAARPPDDLLQSFLRFAPTFLRQRLPGPVVESAGAAEWPPTPAAPAAPAAPAQVA